MQTVFFCYASDIGAKALNFVAKSLNFGTKVVAFGTKSMNFETNAMNSRTKAANFEIESLDFGIKAIAFRTNPMNFGAKTMNFGTKAADSGEMPFGAGLWVRFLWLFSLDELNTGNGGRNMDWRKYEKEIYAIFKREFPKAEITSDTKLKGRYSLINRQIDILIQDYVAGNRITIVIDAKFFNQKIDVKDVECFIGMLADIGVHKGLLITQEGYTNAAIKRAYNDPSDVELDILNFKELKEYHGFLAFPFAGDISVFLPAPFGCVIDNRTKENDWLALIYQRGLTFEEAADKREWMYVNFWDRRIKNVSLDDLLKIQLATFDGLEAQIEMVPTIKRERNKTALRKVTIPTYPAPEYTGFVEFEDFIFYAVMFSPIELESKNIRKLENIMINVIPGKVKHEKPESEQVIE